MLDDLRKRYSWFFAHKSHLHYPPSASRSVRTSGSENSKWTCYGENYQRPFSMCLRVWRRRRIIRRRKLCKLSWSFELTGVYVSFGTFCVSRAGQISSGPRSRLPVQPHLETRSSESDHSSSHKNMGAWSLWPRASGGGAGAMCPALCIRQPKVTQLLHLHCSIQRHQTDNQEQYLKHHDRRVRLLVR